jgi:bacillopeptidase F
VPVPVGNLLADFNFGQTPVAPLIQTTLIPVDFQPTFTTAYVATFPLTWARVTAGPVATYTVKRTTTSGSGYEPVQGCSPSGKWMFRDVRCTDKTAVAGTTYHYVVTSTTAAGVESPNSAEVDVTP